jgi:hypothetical protein
MALFATKEKPQTTTPGDSLQCKIVFRQVQYEHFIFVCKVISDLLEKF